MGVSMTTPTCDQRRVPKMATYFVSFVSLLIVLFSLLNLSYSLDIKVYNGTQFLKSYRDRNAIFNGRSTSLYEEEGLLMYPVPRNACSTVDTDNGYDIAYVANYDDCPLDNIEYIASAGYSMMVSYSPSSQTLPADGVFSISVVLLNDNDFAEYLMSLLDSSNSSNILLKVTEDYWSYYEKIIIIFCLVLMCAVSLAICLFLCTFCARWSYQKWRRRGLTRWRIRQLPQRRYNSARETSQTCSICLDDFSEGEKLRVLPCDHVFHPKCVDEWLQKWKRTCPLCKSQISRRRDRSSSERSSLLNSEERATSPTYGATTERVRLFDEQRPSEEEEEEQNEGSDN